MDTMQWLIILVGVAFTSAYDPSLSNGTCYYGAKKKADNGYIPCGNAAGGVQSCCQARDICLSSNACFNAQYGVTYLAGCTDGNYDDDACPSKGDFSNQQWVGLVRCGVSSGTGEEWAACNEPSQPKVNKGNTSCSCDPSRDTAVFTDAATLTNIASLPVSVGNAIAWYPGFTPSTTSAAASTIRISMTSMTVPPAGLITVTPGTSIGATSSALPTAPVDSASSSSLSPGAKAGIGVGTAGGVIGVAALILLFFQFRRRKSREVPPIKDQIRPSSLGAWGVENGGFSVEAGRAAENHKSWGGQSELPTEANEVTTVNTSLGENTIRTTFNTPNTMYQPYQNSPTVATSEVDGSPAGSTSGLAPGKPLYEKPVYGGPVYELPG